MSHIGFVDFEAAKPPPPPEPVSQWPENLTKLAVGRSVKHRDLTKAGDIPPHAVHPDPLDPSFLVNCFKFCTGISTESMSIRFLKAACSCPGSAGRERA